MAAIRSRYNSKEDAQRARNHLQGMGVRVGALNSNVFAGRVEWFFLLYVH